MTTLAFDTHQRSPSNDTAAKNPLRHASKHRSNVVRPTATVLAAGGLGHDAEISTSVIQAVSVDMVYVDLVSVFGQSEQLSVKPVERPGFSGPTVPSNIAISSGSALASNVQMPSPLVRPFGIGGIDDGVRTDATTTGAERDAYGILKAHSDLPPDVVPPAASNSAGVSYVNDIRTDG